MRRKKFILIFLQICLFDFHQGLNSFLLVRHYANRKNSLHRIRDGPKIGEGAFNVDISRCSNSYVWKTWLIYSLKAAIVSFLSEGCSIMIILFTCFSPATDTANLPKTTCSYDSSWYSTSIFFKLPAKFLELSSLSTFLCRYKVLLILEFQVSLTSQRIPEEPKVPKKAFSYYPSCFWKRIFCTTFLISSLKVSVDSIFFRGLFDKKHDFCGLYLSNSRRLTNVKKIVIVLLKKSRIAKYSSFSHWDLCSYCQVIRV